MTVIDGQDGQTSEGQVNEQVSESTIPDQQTAQPSEAVPGQPQTQDEEFVRVPKSQLEQYGGRFGEALKAANAYRQLNEDGSVEFLKRMGVSGKDLLAMLEEQGQDDSGQQDAETGMEHGQQGDEDRPLTVKEFQRLQAQQQAEMQKREAERRERESIEQGRQREADVALQALKEAGLAPEDNEQWDHTTEAFAQMFYGLVNRAMRESIPSHYGDKAKQQILSKPASPSALNLAKQWFSDMMKDTENTAVAKFASKQSKTPGATMGSGSGGKTPQKAWDDMTLEEQVNAIAGPD
jgi:hypothetical protein